MSRQRRQGGPGIRTRTATVAAVVVGLAVALTMTVLVLSARSSLKGQIAQNAEARADDIALLAQRGTVPDPVPGQGENMLVQVFDAHGEVIASSASIEGQPPLVDLRLAPGASRTYTVASLLVSDSSGEAGEGGAEANTPFLISGKGVSSSSGAVTIVVAASLDPVQQLVDALVPQLVVGLPVIMLVVGATVWMLTGWALRPVEAIRSEAEAISASSLARRVPDPGTTDEIGRLAGTMNRMLGRLEASVTAQRRFVSDAAHELKSPVASMRTMLEVARLLPPADLDALLDDLAAEDLRLEQLVHGLLLLARADEGIAPTDRIEVDVDDVVLAEAGAIGKASGVPVDVSDVRPARVRAESGAIDSLVRNLLENAARHARTRVWVTLDRSGGTARLVVSDDGTGIPPEDRERIFERFVRLDESRNRAGGGTGLGLALCRAIVASLDGSIQVIEPLHDGATLEATFPVEPIV